MKKIWIVLYMIPAIALSQEKEARVDFSGFIDAYYAVRSSPPYDFMSTRNRFRGEMKMRKNNSYFFTSFNVLHNSVIPSQTGFELREAYFEYETNEWDISLGRQIVVWGVADALQITDIISPLDFTEFLARDYDDIRVPANALRVKFHKSKVQFEVIYVPIPSFAIIPYGPDNPWSVFPSSGTPVFDVDMNNEPEKLLKNSEYGGRLSFFISGMDLSISSLHTWNKTPVFSNSFSMGYDTVFVNAHYAPLNLLSMDFSIPKGSLVFRGEIAYYLKEIQGLKEVINGNATTHKNSVNALLGIDWYPGNGWNITAQYSLKFIEDHITILQENEVSNLATVGIYKSFFQDNLTLSTFGYLDLDNKGVFDRTSVEYSLSDNINIFIGYDLFQGDEGIFSPYKNNSEFWFKAKYNF